jgi:flavin reductase (DIM6/NTAB) family NADH-FMN oxidoreductase RutF
MPDNWDGVVDLLDYPMFVVTTRVGDERAGCLVGFATQASIDPPRFLVGLSDKNHTYRVAQRAERLAVHVLDRGDRHLAELFGSQTGDEVDKFAQCAWQDGPGGLPVLDDAPAWFVGRVVSRHPLGDHVAHLLEPEAAHVREGDLTLLTFAAVRDLDPGHDA